MTDVSAPVSKMKRKESESLTLTCKSMRLPNNSNGIFNALFPETKRTLGTAAVSSRTGGLFAGCCPSIIPLVTGMKSSILSRIAGFILDTFQKLQPSVISSIRPALKIPSNLGPNPLSHQNRDAIPNHPVSVVVASPERECIRHSLQPRVFAHCVRPRAARKSFIGHQSRA